MDLVEGVKKGNVWKLESEAFKKPIEIKFWYDNHDILVFDTKIEELKHQLDLHDKQITKLNWANVDHNLFRDEFQNKVNNKQYQIDELREELKKKWDEVNQLYKVIADLKTMTETLSWTILHQQKQIEQIQQKLTKQPVVFHDKCFISGRENAWLWMYWIDNGDYLMILNVKIWEHNEYVTNTDQLIVEEIHVDMGNYVPFYKLEWGTELDLPTATIYYDLVFMPI